MAVESRRWYVAQTKARSEGLATAALRSRGIEVFFPRLVVDRWALPAMRAAAATEPLFPGYLFVRLDLACQFSAATWTPGVRALVAFGEGTPASLDDVAIAMLRERAGGGDIVPPREVPRPGKLVEVRHGPFAGLLGVIERPVTGTGRVRILLEILRRQTSVEMRADAVVPL
jgi:transcriptional antiterminator RfaH